MELGLGPRRLIPSMSMLLAFDAAARTGSFTAAARELNLTQGAVSKQIIALEEMLGAELFVRAHHTVSLTAAGRAYAKDVRSALDLIVSSSMRVLANPRGGTLNLAMLPTFGTRWLMPRFPGFLKSHPDVTVNFATRLSPFDFRTEHFDAAIHFGKPDWPGAQCTYLMGEEIVPVGSPALQEGGESWTPERLAHTPLLHIASRLDAWPEWFRAHGIAHPECEGMYFEQFLTAAQAAAAGLGVALLPTFLVEGELQRGELVQLLDQPLRSERGYYLVVPDDHVDDAPVVAFREWLLQAVREAN